MAGAMRSDEWKPMSGKRWGRSDERRSDECESTSDRHDEFEERSWDEWEGLMGGALSQGATPVESDDEIALPLIAFSPALAPPTHLLPRPLSRHQSMGRGSE
jgi:hypothetical protein